MSNDRKSVKPLPLHGTSTPSRFTTQLTLYSRALLGLLFCGLPLHSQITLEGDVRDTDSKQYRMLPFQVPEGTRRIEVRFSYTNRSKGVILTTGIFDPLMFRGTGRSSFSISESDGTPPFNPGPIPSGTWNLLLGVAQIPPQQTSHYAARIELAGSVDGSASPIIRPQSGWYKGDLHSHTGDSDGFCFSQAARTSRALYTSSSRLPRGSI